MQTTRDDVNVDAILSAIAEGSTDAIIRMDPEGTIISWTRGAERLLGYNRDEIIGKPLSTILPPGERHHVYDSIFSQLTGKEDVIHEESFRISRDGREIPVQITRIPLPNVKGEIVSLLSIIKDISTEKSLKKQVDTLQRNTAMAKVAAKVAHEIRTPLGVLFLKSDMLNERIQALFEDMGKCDVDRHRSRMEKCVTDIQRQINRLEEIANNYLHLSKSRITERQKVQIVPLVHEVIREQKAQFKQTTIDIEVDADAPVPDVYVDPQQIQRVLGNLIKNSLEALTFSKTENPTILIKTISLEDSVEVEVRDNGPGMPAEIRQDVFDPFITTKSIGTGLGLYLAQEIVHNHGGQIMIESAEGDGTTVRLRFPVAANT